MPQVQIGDIILYPVGPASRWLSKLVGWGQRVIGQEPAGRQYSHVAIVGPDTQHIYEAYWPRIRISPIDLSQEFYHIKGITSEQVAQMMTYCQSQVGKRYDMVSILTLGLVHLGGTQVCSELAYHAAEAAGIVLYPPEYFESPDDIAASAKIERVL